MNILLVSPAVPDTFWSFRHVLGVVARKAAFPPLGLLTVAAMLPRDWNLRLVDLDVGRLEDDDIAWADYVFVSGMIVHKESCRAVAARCAAAGTPIVAGGPLFTTGAEGFPEIPHVVIGEAEEVMPTLVADMTAGRVQPRYEAPRRPELALTPIPRWDLVDLHEYLMVPVQFSRGCPFDCEFCDIPPMYGRTPRVKPSERMIAELDAVVDAGWRETVFVVDDNFIGHRAKAKALLRAIIAWRARRGVRLALVTEASLNLVDDPELLDLMVRAGFRRVFVGIETPDDASLAECGKVQNRQRDLAGAVRMIQNAGLEVMAGFIIGFDHDQPNVFQRQLAFIQEAGIVTAMVGLLNALPQTRLFARLSREGRLLRETTGNNLDAVLNFVPRLDRDQLLEGYRTLLQQLYAPKAYYRRILRFLREYRPRERSPLMIRMQYRPFLRSLWLLGVRSRGRLAYWSFLVRALLFHGRAFGDAMTLAIMGHHYRMVAATI